MEITNNESPEQETDKASVEADSQESNCKSGKATKRNGSWQYCDNCFYNCKSEKKHKKHKTSKHKELNKCTLCGKECDGRTSLNCHIDKVHDNSGVSTDDHFTLIFLYPIDQFVLPSKIDKDLGVHYLTDDI